MIPSYWSSAARKLWARDKPTWSRTGSPISVNLASFAAFCLGVDLLETETRKLAEAGFNVTVADLTRAPLNRQFDLIVAGEVLEHVDAPGKFMKNCAAMLRPEGRLAITVPNPWYVNAVLKNAVRSQTFVDSADHVCWYDAVYARRAWPTEWPVGSVKITVGAGYSAGNV
jgi:SAM-dependent methyltransferase